MSIDAIETACADAIHNGDLLAADALIRLLALNGREEIA